MTATSHAMTGALVALAIKNPVAAIPLAFISHFVLDMIPHFGVPPGKFVLKKYAKFLISDFFVLLASAIVLAILFPHKIGIIFVCMAVATAPDFAWLFYRKELETGDIQKLDFFNRFHQNIQAREFMKGIFVEAPFFILLWLIILIKYR